MAVQPEKVFLQIQDKIFTAKSAKKKIQQKSGELDTDPSHRRFLFFDVGLHNDPKFIQIPDVS